VPDLVKPVVAIVAARDGSLILHVGLPAKSRGFESVDQVGLGEGARATAACASVECGGRYADVVGLTRPSQVHVSSGYPVAICQT